MAKSSIENLIQDAVEAGKNRNYKTAIKILEDLVAKGFAELGKSPLATSKKSYPEIYLYLSRAWNAEKQPIRAITFGKAYTFRCPTDPAGWFFLGRAYLSNENFSKAIIALEKSLSLKENDLNAMAMLGMAFLKSKQAHKAKSIFEQALKLSPDNKRLNQGYLNSLFVDAVHNFKDGHFELARQMLTFVINNGIDGVAPRLYLAHTLRSMKAIPEALSQYNAAIQFAPEDKALQWYPASMMLEMGDLTSATETLIDLGLNIEEKNVSEQFLAMGVIRQHIEKGDWNRALSAGRLYTKAFGSSVEIHLLLAEAQKHLGKIDLALNHYNRALAIEENNPYIYYAMFDALQISFRWEMLSKAILNAEKANCIEYEELYFYKVITAAHIDNPPEEVLPHLQAIVKNEKHASDPLVYNALGICYVKLGLPELALRWYEKTIEQCQTDEEAKIGLIACYEALTMHKELFTAYKDYLQNWDNIDIRSDFANFLNITEQWSELSEQLEIISIQTKKNLDLDIALALRKSGLYRKSAIMYRKMLRQKPKEKIFLHNLVFCLDKMGQVKTAIDLLKAARKAFGYKTDSMIIEGILCLRSKQIEDSIRLFQYVVDKEPNNKIASDYLKQAMDKIYNSPT